MKISCPSSTNLHEAAQRVAVSDVNGILEIDGVVALHEVRDQIDTLVRSSAGDVPVRNELVVASDEQDAWQPESGSVPRISGLDEPGRSPRQENL